MATWKKLNGGTPIDKVLSEVFGDFHGAALTVRDAIPLYLADAAQRKRPTTIEGDTYRLAQVGEARWAGKVLGRVTSADLLAWIRERQKPRQRERRRARRPEETLGQYRKAKDKRETVTVLGASGATINRDVAIVSALFEWAIGLAYATDNPARKVETFTESKGREVYLTADEARALVGTCGPALRPIVLAALHTGMRRGELLALRWRSVDFTRGEVYVEPDTEKAGRGRTVPLTANLKAVLAGLKSGRTVVSMDGSDPVFSLSGGAPLPKTALRSMFVRGGPAVRGHPPGEAGGGVLPHAPPHGGVRHGRGRGPAVRRRQGPGALDFGGDHAVRALRARGRAERHRPARCRPVERCRERCREGPKGVGDRVDSDVTCLR